MAAGFGASAGGAGAFCAAGVGEDIAGADDIIGAGEALHPPVGQPVDIVVVPHELQPVETAVPQLLQGAGAGAQLLQAGAGAAQLVQAGAAQLGAGAAQQLARW